MATATRYYIDADGNPIPYDSGDPTSGATEGYVDAAVQVETDRATAAEADLQGQIDAIEVGGGSFDLPAAIHAATGKTTPVDADEIPLSDSAASFGLKKLTWANLKATLKAYFDTLYPSKNIVTKSTAANYTVGTTNPLELYGGIIYVTAAATITVPAVVSGGSFTVITIGAVAVSIDPNASDLIYLDGVALSDGDKITNLSTAGDIATLTYLDGTGWYAATNGWTDGN